MCAENFPKFVHYEMIFAFAIFRPSLRLRNTRRAARHLTRLRARDGPMLEETSTRVRVHV